MGKGTGRKTFQPGGTIRRNFSIKSFGHTLADPVHRFSHKSSLYQILYYIFVFRLTEIPAIELLEYAFITASCFLHFSCFLYQLIQKKLQSCLRNLRNTGFSGILDSLCLQIRKKSPDTSNKISRADSLSCPIGLTVGKHQLSGGLGQIQIQIESLHIHQLLWPGCQLHPLFSQEIPVHL